MLMVTTAADGVDAAEGIRGSHQPARVGVELRGRTGLAGSPYSGAAAACGRVATVRLTAAGGRRAPDGDAFLCMAITPYSRLHFGGTPAATDAAAAISSPAVAAASGTTAAVGKRTRSWIWTPSASATACTRSRLAPA